MKALKRLSMALAVILIAALGCYAVAAHAEDSKGFSLEPYLNNDDYEVRQEQEEVGGFTSYEYIHPNKFENKDYVGWERELYNYQTPPDLDVYIYDKESNNLFLTNAVHVEIDAPDKIVDSLGHCHHRIIDAPEGKTETTEVDEYYSGIFEEWSYVYKDYIEYSDGEKDLVEKGYGDIDIQTSIGCYVWYETIKSLEEYYDELSRDGKETVEESLLYDGYHKESDGSYTHATGDGGNTVATIESSDIIIDGKRCFIQKVTYTYTYRSEHDSNLDSDSTRVEWSCVVVDEQEDFPGYYSSTRYYANLKYATSGEASGFNPYINEAKVKFNDLIEEYPSYVASLKVHLSWASDADIDTVVDTTAGSSEGEDVGVDIDTRIVDPDKSKIDNEGDNQNGSAGTLPGAVVGGVLVGAAGAAAAASANKKKKEEKSNPAYRMKIYKAFGDTLHPGQEKQICARIVEVGDSGVETPNLELSAHIQIYAGNEAVQVTQIGIQGDWMCANVVALPDTAINEAVVSFAFYGAGGTFTENVHFKIEELKLIFPDYPLAFVAGKGETYVLPFKILDPTAVEGLTPTFTACFKVASGSADFKDLCVKRDPDYPKDLFALEMCECGKADNNEPGMMLAYAIEVTATFPACGAASQSFEMRGETKVFRFYEGLRFSCEPLKGYYEKYVAGKEEKLVTGDELLTNMALAQSAALGMAGGFDAAVLHATMDRTVRESARDVRLRFPEIFSEDTVYVYDSRDKVMLTPGRTHAYVTLYATKEDVDENGLACRRPASLLPTPENIQLFFADIEGSSVLKDKEGNDVARPCEQLDFKYFIKKVQGADNTVVMEILPTNGYLVPPNRAKARVMCRVVWEGREFKKTVEVNVISQPLRANLSSTEQLKKYMDEDDDKIKFLRQIQERILQVYFGKLAAKGTLSISETVGDLVSTAVDHPILAFNPLTSGGTALYSLYTSCVRQVSSDVYYDDLMPIYHLIENQIQGHAYEFGLHMPTIQNIVVSFARHESGEIGSAEAIDLAGKGYDMVFADTLDMTVRDWNHSWVGIAARIGFAVGTGGQSEWLYMPLSAITNGMEASVDYIDRGGDSLLEAYRVGMDAGAKHFAFEGAIALGVHAAVTVVGKCITTAPVLAKEAAEQGSLFKQGIKEMFSAGEYAKSLSAAAKGIEGQVANAAKQAQGAIRAFRGEAAIGAGIEREIAYTLGRLEGIYKIDAFKNLVTSGGKTLSVYEKRAVVLMVQSDKHAMRAMMEATGAEADALRATYNAVMSEIKKGALLKSRQALVSRLNRTVFKGKPKITMEEIRVKGTSGNASADIVAGKKVPMDMDATFEFWDEAAKKWKDVRSAVGQEIFDAEFYKLCKGYAGSVDDMANFAKNADMTITDMFHPEAYSPEYADALRVVNASRAGEAFTYGAKVASVAENKCTHWLSWAKKAASEADVYKAARNTIEAQKYAAASEAFVEESARQFTKQTDRIIINKVMAMEARGIAINTSVDLGKFLEKYAVLNRSGLGRFGGTGLTSGEIEAVLKKGYGCTLESLYHDLNTLTVELDNLIKAADEAAKAVK